MNNFIELNKKEITAVSGGGEIYHSQWSTQTEVLITGGVLALAWGGGLATLGYCVGAWVWNRKMKQVADFLKDTAQVVIPKDAKGAVKLLGDILEPMRKKVAKEKVQ